MEEQHQFNMMNKTQVKHLNRLNEYKEQLSLYQEENRISKFDEIMEKYK